MKRIEIGDIGKFFKEEHEDLLRLAVLTLDTRIKTVSPVDTGRFRMSWQVGENTAAGGIAFGPVTPSAVTPVHRLNYFKENIKNTYHIHNNLPYAEPLAMGHSDQAPAGWLDLIAKEESSRMKRNWETILRRSV